MKTSLPLFLIFQYQFLFVVALLLFFNHFSCMVFCAFRSGFSGHCELFPQPDRNAKPQSGVDQVTVEQSSFLNASVYP